MITRLQFGLTKATKSHILSRGPPAACHHCGQTLSIDHMLLECAVLQECRDEYYTADSLKALFETIPETCIMEFLREAGFVYLIWLVKHSIQFITWITPDLMEFVNFIYPSDLDNIIRFEQFVYRMQATLRHTNICRTANISRRTCVVVKQIQSNSIQSNQSLICTQRLMNIHWSDIGYSYPCITIWKFVPASDMCTEYWDSTRHSAALGLLDDTWHSTFIYRSLILSPPVADSIGGFSHKTIQWRVTYWHHQGGTKILSPPRGRLLQQAI